jgi:hypothetical protein
MRVQTTRSYITPSLHHPANENARHAAALFFSFSTHFTLQNELCEIHQRIRNLQTIRVWSNHRRLSQATQIGKQTEPFALHGSGIWKNPEVAVRTGYIERTSRHCETQLRAFLRSMLRDKRNECKDVACKRRVDTAKVALNGTRKLTRRAYNSVMDL